MTVEAKFDAFHAANPHVYKWFKQFAYELLKAGHTMLSSKMIVNRIRWECAISTTGSGWHVAARKPFLIDDRFTAWYSRKFCADFPMLAGKFEQRTIRRP